MGAQWHLVPILLVLYLVAYIDKTNIGWSSRNMLPSLDRYTDTRPGNAKIEGLTKSLHLDGIKYNIALSIFFIPYVLAGKNSPNHN